MEVVIHVILTLSKVDNI